MSNIPQSRVEKILHAMTGEQIELEPPQSRVEEDLMSVKEAIEQGGGGSGGTTDYNALRNKPTLNGTTLQGNLTSEDVGVEENQTVTYDPSLEKVTISQAALNNILNP